MSDFTVQREEREEHVFAGRARGRRVFAVVLAIGLVVAALAWLTGVLLAGIQSSGLPPLLVPVRHGAGRSGTVHRSIVQAPGGARVRVVRTR